LGMYYNETVRSRAAVSVLPLLLPLPPSPRLDPFLVVVPILVLAEEATVSLPLPLPVPQGRTGVPTLAPGSYCASWCGPSLVHVAP